MTPDPEQPRASRNRRRGETVNLMPRLAAAAAVVLVIAVLFNLAIHKLERSPPVQPEYQNLAQEAPASPPGPAENAPLVPVSTQGIERLEEKRPAIETAVRGFFQATLLEEKLAHSRHPDRVRPFMQAYYDQDAPAARAVSGLGTCQSVAEKGQRLGYIEVLFTSGNPVRVIVEEDLDGRFRVDWESLVLYGEMEWETFLRQKPKEPTLLRVIATHLPAPAQGSNREWLEITRPGQKKRLRAFFDRQDPKLKPLVEQLQLGSWKNVPLTLRLCYSESKLDADTARIVSSEGKGWLILTDRRS